MSESGFLRVSTQRTTRRTGEENAAQQDVLGGAFTVACRGKSLCLSSCSCLVLFSMGTLYYALVNACLGPSHSPSTLKAFLFRVDTGQE